MQKLFAVYVGGSTESSNIELHDMRFVITERIEDSYGELKRQWWGTPESLHLDGWQEVTHTEDYRITLKSTPPATESENKLFFVNLGGYNEIEFTELHRNVFVVAPTESKAKVKALKQVHTIWPQFHKDYLYDVEKTFCLNQVAAEKNLYIHLEKTENLQPLPFTNRYVPIGKKEAA